MPTINEAIWNYASGLTSPETIVKSYTSYLRSGVTKAKELISLFQLRLNDEISDQEVEEQCKDAVYYYKGHLLERKDLINNAAQAVFNVENNNDFNLNYNTISFSQTTLDGDVINIRLDELKDSFVNDLDTVYYSSVLFASAEPLLNNNLSTAEKIMAKGQIYSEALSQIPNANADKISQLQSFVDNVANSTYDQQSILNMLFDFCGFSAFNNVTKANLNEFITDVPVVELDNYTGQTPLNGFINSVTDYVSEIDTADVISFGLGVLFPAYGAYKLYKSIKKYAPKVLGAIGNSVVDFGANVITSINNVAVDPIDFMIDKGEYYSMCANGFNFGGTGSDERDRTDILSGEPATFSIISNKYSGLNSGPTTFNTIFGAVSIGYAPTYECSYGVTRLKPFNFSNYENLTFDELFDLSNLNYFQLQTVLSLTKPASDFKVDDNNYQLRNKILNGTYISAVCLPITFLPIYYYIKLLDRLDDYDLSTNEGKLFYSQLYNALFINSWDGSVYPVNVGDVSDGVAMSLLQGIGRLLFTCSKLLIKSCQSAALGQTLVFKEQVEVLDNILDFDITINFKAYNDVPFNNTHALLATTSTPLITRTGLDPRTVKVKYVSNDINYTMFSNDYWSSGGFYAGSTLYNEFIFINNLLNMENEAVKSFVYLPYSHGSMPEPTYHVATDKENVDNFSHALSVVTFAVISIIAVAVATKYMIKAKRSLITTQSLIQTKKQALGQAILSGDSTNVDNLTTELVKLRKKEKFLNFIGAGSLASTSEVVISNQSDEVVDSVCSYVNTKIGV